MRSTSSTAANSRRSSLRRKRTAVGIFLLPLPNGQVLVLTSGQAHWPRCTRRLAGHRPAGHRQSQRRPRASRADRPISVTGTQFNGLSEAASYGDELDAATNYPLVRITNTATGHVFYARTHGFSMGVATGATPVTTQFDVPANTETGASTLVVVANGIASAPVNMTVV